jgi:DNA-binding NtrC family response regulator
MSISQSSRARVLYVEDDPVTGRLVKALVEREGHALHMVASGQDFLKRLREETPDLCLLDLNLPDISGLDLLEKLRGERPDLPAIVLTTSGAIEDVVRAMRLGAVDYVAKPPDAQRLGVSLKNALTLSRQRQEIDGLRGHVQEGCTLVGASRAMEDVRTLIRKAASSESTVLVTGENGTGKELVARSLHYTGARASKPFIDINCAALAESLLESELFGHEQGAFTGATSRRRGKFEQAHGGTLFLDEIGDMPMPTQAKILRALQERKFQRVGGSEIIQVDVRVVCATNRNLEAAVGQGTFRQDLYYRINTLVIEIPPLRDRMDDIPSLARRFLSQAAFREKRQIQEIAPAALEALLRHRWPGNVRELQHAVDRAVLVCEGEEIRPEHLPPAVMRQAPATEPGIPASKSLVETVERLEQSLILDALEKSGWVKARAARMLGITERIMSYKIDNLGIKKPNP